MKSVPGRIKASALKLLFKNVQIVCLKFRISLFGDKRGSEKGDGRKGDPLGETTGRISTDETR